MYRVLKALKLSVHPDKTQIGKLSNGLVFLGFCFKTNATPKLADITLSKCYAKLRLLLRSGTTVKRVNRYISLALALGVEVFFVNLRRVAIIR